MDRTRLLPLILVVPVVALSLILVAAPRPVARAGDDSGIRVKIASTGVVTIESPAANPRTIGRLASDDPEVSDATLDRLRDEFRSATKAPELREADGTSKVRLILEAVATTPWRHVQWLMQVAADPTVKIVHLRFVRPDGKDWGDQDLPGDRTGPAPVQPEPKILRVAMFRLDLNDSAKTRTKFKFQEYELVLHPKSPLAKETDESAEREKLLAVLTQRLREAKVDAKDALGEIDAPPPSGSAVPYVDVLGVMDSMRAAGLEKILFQGTPAPLSRTAK